MKVGDYVRTKNRGIYKLADIRYGARKYVYELERYKHGIRCFIRVRKDEVVSSSENIIDLIEDGDYVNGYKIVVKNNIKFVETKNGLEFFGIFWISNIKSIVTKQQLERIEYEVGE